MVEYQVIIQRKGQEKKTYTRDTAFRAYFLFWQYEQEVKAGGSDITYLAMAEKCPTITQGIEHEQLTILREDRNYEAFDWHLALS